MQAAALLAVRSFNSTMINPSAIGWIDKFFITQPFPTTGNHDLQNFYRNIRKSGFIYGHIVSLGDGITVEFQDWTRDEISKLALLNCLYGIYRLSENGTHKDFTLAAVEFYREMNPQGLNIFKKIFGSNPSATLEEIIDERVRTNQDIISRNFSHVVTNALLFIDVLAFRKFLLRKSIPLKYLKKVEETVITVISLALKTKTVKSQHDDQLIRLFEASVRYNKFSSPGQIDLESLKLDYLTDDLEKYYLVDLACMVLWSDGQIENEEAYFLYKIADLLNIADTFVDESIMESDAFITRYKSEIAYFNFSNPVKHFYDNITQSVVLLISRNKKRLVKEISQSRELMVLLAHSTQRDLDAKEKKKIKAQMLEICKTIPSLTIFLLPGGSLLLPILIKFIPQLLPSSFNENTQE